MPEKRIKFFTCLVTGIALTGGMVLHAQRADQAWLRYAADHGRIEAPRSARALGSGALELSAAS